MLCYPAGGETAPEGFPPDCVCAADEMPARYLPRFAPDFDVLDGIARSSARLLPRGGWKHRVFHREHAAGANGICAFRCAGRARCEGLTRKPAGGRPTLFTQEAGRVTVRLALEADEACFLLPGCERQAIPARGNGGTDHCR